MTTEQLAEVPDEGAIVCTVLDCSFQAAFWCKPCGEARCYVHLGVPWEHTALACVPSKKRKKRQGG